MHETPGRRGDTERTRRTSRTSVRAVNRYRESSRTPSAPVHDSTFRPFERKPLARVRMQRYLIYPSFSASRTISEELLSRLATPTRRTPLHKSVSAAQDVRHFALTTRCHGSASADRYHTSLYSPTQFIYRYICEYTCVYICDFLIFFYQDFLFYP